MDIDELKNIKRVLSIVAGDCPYEHGVGEGNKGGQLCSDHETCEDCWRSELSKELNKREGQ